MQNYVYILECKDGTLYTGWKLVYSECYATKEEALRREYAIKQMSRKEKAALITPPPQRSTLTPDDKHSRP